MKHLLISSLLTISVGVFSQKVQLFEHTNYGGSVKHVETDWNVGGSEADWNDRISSMVVPKDWIVIAYEHSSFTGRHVVITGNWEAKGDWAGWNDRISSFQILNGKNPYAMVYVCEVKRGNTWSRYDDFTLASNGVGYIGTHKILAPEVKTDTLIWRADSGNPSTAAIIVGGNDITGVVKDAGGHLLELRAELRDLRADTYPPTMARLPLNEMAERPWIDAKPQPKPQPRPQPTPTPQPTQPTVWADQGYVKLYRSDNFTGQSRIITGDWNPSNTNDRLNWADEINSITVSPGWAIRVYMFTGYSGPFLEIADNWSSKDQPDWKDEISSIRVVRRAKLDAWGRVIPEGIQVYRSANFTGESRIISGNWTPQNSNDRLNWADEINSIKIPPGWAIRAYRFTDYGGSFLELTDNWSSNDYPDWKDEISSIKIVRKTH